MPSVDQLGGLHGNDPRCRQQAGQRHAGKRDEQPGAGEHSVARHRGRRGVKSRLMPTFPPEIDELGDGVLRADPAAEDPAQGQGESNGIIMDRSSTRSTVRVVRMVCSPINGSVIQTGPTANE